MYDYYIYVTMPFFYTAEQNNISNSYSNEKNYWKDFNKLGKCQISASISITSPSISTISGNSPLISKTNCSTVSSGIKLW
jgi:hypothetical protein